MEKSFSISEALGAGWETFKKNPGLLVGVVLVVFIVNILANVALNVYFTLNTAFFIYYTVFYPVGKNSWSRKGLIRKLQDLPEKIPRQACGIYRQEHNK